MEPLLFLAHRIPYPPNKGDKIRSWHLIKHLSQDYRIHLGCFIDDPEDWHHQQTLAACCASVHCLGLPPLRAYTRGLGALARGLPITLPFYYQKRMRDWVLETIRENNISQAFAFSSSMAQYLEDPRLPPLRRVIDFVDVDSDKWGQYAATKPQPLRWVYQREQRLLAAYEHRIARDFDAALLVSEDERALFCKGLPERVASRVHSLPNGVDTDYFDPALTPAGSLPEEAGQEPAEPGKRNPARTDASPFIVFTGAMDYWANEDAVLWFSDEVWPRLQASHPELRFLVVGSRPTARIRDLDQRPGIQVTGRVADIRPYLAAARFAVAPLRIARGIQNKVLEALAMGRPVVATSMALEGLEAPPELDLHEADEAEAFTRACQGLLERPESGPVSANRDHVVRHYSWEGQLQPLKALIQGRTA